jgi:Holliday junction DNA helicase RuvA
MIGYIKGNIIDILNESVIIDVSGVGYEVFLSQRLFGAVKIGQEYGFVIYTNVKEDQLSLFGFADKLDKKVFLDLLKVSGVGAKTALAIIGAFDSQKIIDAVCIQDAKLFQTISGIGKKASERIIMDLKDKFKNLDFPLASNIRNDSSVAINDNTRDAISALENLGYNKSQILKAIDKVSNQAESLEELIKMGLKELV